MGMIPGLPPVVVLETQTVGSGGSASITLPASGTIQGMANFPGGSYHILIKVNAQSEDAVVERNLELRLNGDTAGNYNDQLLKGSGAAKSAVRASGQTAATIGVIPGTSVHADAFGGGSFLIPAAFLTDDHKTILALTGAAENSVQCSVARWNKTPEAIDSVTLFASAGDLAEGTVIKLCVVDEYYKAAPEQILAADGTMPIEGLPQGRGDIILIGSLRSARVSVTDGLNLILNDDATAGSYAGQNLTGSGASAAASTASPANSLSGLIADSADANAFGAHLVTIQQHSLGDNDPHVLHLGGYHGSSSVSTVAVVSTRRNNVENITKVELVPQVVTNFLAGSGMWAYFVPKRLLKRVTLTASAPSVPFADISQKYRDTRLNVYGRSAVAAATDDFMVEHNGDAVAANYDVQELTGDGAVVAAAVDPASQKLLTIPGNTAGANIFGGGSILFSEYAKSDRHKHRLSIGGAADDIVGIRSGRHESNDPITSLTVYAASGDLMAGSVFELEGIGRVDDDIWAEIDGVEIQKEKGSLSIRTAIESRDTCDFTVVDQAGTATYSKGQPVEVLQNCEVMFGGIIDSVTRTKFEKSTTVFHAVRATGWAALMDKRLAAESYTGDTAEAIVRDLATKYLNPEGIWLGNIETGPTIAEMVVNYASLSRVMDVLAERAGFVWNVDEIKRFTFQPPATTLAPNTIDTDMITRLTPTVTERAPEYRNRQYIRAGRGVTSPQTETFTGDGDTVAFPVGYPIFQVPTVTVAAAGQSVGIKGLETAKDCYWSKSDPIVVFDTAPAGAAAVVIEYVGEYNLLLVADEPGKITARAAIEGGTGIWEKIDDEPAITDVDAARDSAIAKLDKFAVIGDSLSFDTVEAGFAPGQFATVSWLSLGDMLIESVEINEIAAGVPTYHITALTGPAMGDWTRFFRHLDSQKDEVLERLTIGRDELVIIVVREGDDWDWTETVTEDVFACAVPAVTLFPLGTLFPC